MSDSQPSKTRTPAESALQKRLAAAREKLADSSAAPVSLASDSLADQPSTQTATASPLQARLAQARRKLTDTTPSTTASSSALQERLAQARTRLESSAAESSAVRPTRARLSSIQKRLWLMEQLDAASAAYNMYLVREIIGHLDASVLHRALLALLDRHHVLRTRFVLPNDADEPVGIRDDAPQLIIREESWPEADDANHPVVMEAISREIATPFNLGRDLPIRCTLIHVGEARQVMLLVVHHIAGDAQSLGQLSSELIADYTDFAAGRASRQTAPAKQYSDFADWQHNWLAGKREEQQIAYWRKQLSGAPELICIPTDHTRPAVQTTNGAVSRFRIDTAQLEQIRAQAAKSGSTVFMFLLSAYFLLFQRYAQETDLVVGIPVSGRSRTEFEPIIGAFINTLPIRIQLGPNSTIRELIQRVRDTMFDAFEHQDVPLERLIEVLNPKRSLSHSPIFQLMFNYIHGGPPLAEIDGRPVVPYAYERPRAKTDLSLELLERGGQLQGRLVYNTDLFSASTMARVAGHFMRVVEAMLVDPDRSIGEIDFLSAEEHGFLAARAHGRPAPTRSAQPMHTLFEEQASLHPDAPALQGGGRMLRYRELDQQANQLAHILIEAGLQPEEPVGIFMERNVDVVLSMLAILKAGGAYVPIDITNPPERIATLVDEAHIRFMLTHDEQAPGLGPLQDLQVIRLDSDAARLASQPPRSPEREVSPANLMYVLFTSGSTGRPKGVAVEHRHYFHFFHSIAERMALQPAQHYALVSTFAADLGTPMIWGALCTGGCLHVLSYEESIDPDAFRAYLGAHPIDVIKIVPSHFNALSASAGPVGLLPRRLLVFGGESSHWGTFRRIWAHAPDLRIQISYGPTETTVTASAYEATDDPRYSDDDVVPIGEPLPHCHAYVLDDAGRPRPPGMPGLLHLGGASVARGYLHQPQLTAQRFQPHPSNPSWRLYATGDLVRFDPQGNLHFMGRQDDQVKVRGYRIELGDIRSAIIEASYVADAAVITYEDSAGQRELGAYVVLSNAPTAQFDPTQLRDFLRERLPSYMIPRRYLCIPQIPLNANGKIDRKALPSISDAAVVTGNTQVAPQTEDEHRLLAIWQDVLGSTDIGIDDNFFDLGGDSFKAIRVARAAGAHMSVIDVFKFPTVRELADRLQSKGAGEHELLIELTPPNTHPQNERINVVCVPYGGGNAITFQPLANALPGNYSLFAVELPGHDFSRPAEAFRPLEEVAAECVAQISSKTTGKIVVYGHCLGGALATEIARQLEACGANLVAIVMGGNFPAPRLTGTFFKVWEKLFPRERMISDRMIIDMLRLWGGFLEVVSPAEQKFMVRALRHDRMEAERYYTEAYARDDITPLTAPVLCVCGDADRTTEFFEERYRDWEYFSAQVSLATLHRAGHYFHKHQAADLASLIVEHANAQLAPADRATATAPETTAAPRQSAATHLKKMRRTQQVAPSMPLFLFVALAQLLATLGAGVTGFGLGVWVYEKTQVATDFALVSILTLAPGLFILPFAGAIADRIDRRLILIASSIVAALSSVLVAVALWAGQLSVLAIYVAAFISSIAGAMQRPAYLAAIAQISPKRYLGQANGLSQMVNAAGLMLAPMLGGLLFKQIGLEGLLVVHLVCFVISLCIMLALRFPNTLFRRREEPVLKEVAGGFRYLIQRRSLIVMIVFFLIFNLVWGIPTVLVTPLVLSLDSPTALGMVVAAMSAGTILGGAIMSIWGGTLRRAHGMVGFVILAGISFIVLGLTPNLVSVAVGAFLSRVALSLINTHWQALIQSKVGLELQGRVFAINFLLANMLLPLGSYIAGHLSDRTIPALANTHGFFAALLAPFSTFSQAQAMAFLICFSGAFMVLWGIAGLLYRPLRLMEDALPDAMPDPEINEDKDKLQALADLRAALARDTRDEISPVMIARAGDAR